MQVSDICHVATNDHKRTQTDTNGHKRTQTTQCDTVSGTIGHKAIQFDYLARRKRLNALPIFLKQTAWGLP